MTLPLDHYLAQLDAEGDAVGHHVLVGRLVHTRDGDQFIRQSRLQIPFIVVHGDIRQGVVVAIGVGATVPERVVVAVLVVVRAGEVKAAVVKTVGHHHGEILLAGTPSATGSAGQFEKKLLDVHSRYRPALSTVLRNGVPLLESMRKRLSKSARLLPLAGSAFDGRLGFTDRLFRTSQLSIQKSQRAVRLGQGSCAVSFCVLVHLCGLVPHSLRPIERADLPIQRSVGAIQRQHLAIRRKRLTPVARFRQFLE